MGTCVPTGVSECTGMGTGVPTFSPMVTCQVSPWTLDFILSSD